MSQPAASIQLINFQARIDIPPTKVIRIRNELERGDLNIILVKGLPEETSWNLIWLKSKKFLPATRACLAEIDEEKEGIIHHRFEWDK